MGILARIGFKLVSFEDTKNLYGRRSWGRGRFLSVVPIVEEGFGEMGIS